MEPPDLWSTRLPRGMRDQAVRMETTGDLMHWFRAGGIPWLTLSKYRTLDGGTLEHDTVIEERDQAMSDDGVWGEVIHANLGAFAYSKDNELAFAHARVYNDFIVE